MARKTTTSKKVTAAAVEAPAVDLHALLLDALAANGIKPKVKWAPSKNYCSLYVDGQNIGYVFKQTSRGVRVEPAATLADLSKSTKGFVKGTRSERFALVGVVKAEGDVVHAADALTAAAGKLAEGKAAKAAPAKKAPAKKADGVTRRTKTQARELARQVAADMSAAAKAEAV